jgi:hypothetical protein
MDSSTKSLDRIAFIKHDTDPEGYVTVTIYWQKFNAFDVGFKDTSNRRWLRRQLKRITTSIDNDTKIYQYDLFDDSTDVVFYHNSHAAQFILENS